MSLQLLRYIALPEHVKPGGFDHAAVHATSNRLYVAHTVNDALDVVDCAADRYLYSIHGLTGVAGALVSESQNLVFTSNRGENTVAMFSPDDEKNLVKIQVGIRPNGLSFDARRGLLLAANAGKPEVENSYTLSIVNIDNKEMIYSIPIPGRTRWTVFDHQKDEFYVNIMEPSQICAVAANQPDRINRTIMIPATGPHGLDMDASGRLFCACDDGQLVILEAFSGKILNKVSLSGAPDVIFFNPKLHHLYVAIGEPGVIEVFDTESLTRLESVTTEKSAHTIAFDSLHNKVYAFLPQSHQAAVFKDG